MALLSLLLGFCAFGAIEAGKLTFEPQKGENSVPCPDGTYCQDGTTCCPLSEADEYGCCPYPNAVCCSDKKSCCPNGYTCDLIHLTCNKASSNEILPMGRKRPSMLATPSSTLSPPGDLICADGSVCSGSAACCRTYAGTFNCCLYPNDVCCDDGLHCCSRLTICDQRTLTCMPGRNSAPWDKPVSSVPATPRQMKEIQAQTSSSPNLVCPSGSTCAGTAACCRTYTGIYNCCNYPNDVCCSDGLHCCARGTICDVRNLQCLPGNGVISPWDKPSAAIPSV